VSGNSKSVTLPAGTVADAYLALLAHRGIDYLFANAGTDFVSIVEGLAKAKTLGGKVPVPITAPHENAAISMAHGYYLMTGRPQAVMVHVNVGTANAVAGIANAARSNVPVLMTAGRTPISEFGLPGSRSHQIHWAQEAYDQAEMVREYTKWDYELRHESDLETVVDRALQIASASPKGPVYLTLPREVLAHEIGEKEIRAQTGLPVPTRPAPDPAAVDVAADALLGAKRPLILTTGVGRSVAGVDALARLAERFALPVVQPNPRYMNLPRNHPMHLGYDVQRFIEKADVILVVDSDVPWNPNTFSPPRDCNVIHLAEDPAFSDYPIRGFWGQLMIQAAPELGLPAIEDRMSIAAESKKGLDDEIETRRQRLAAERAEIHGDWDKLAAQETGPGGRINRAWASRRVFDACGEDAVYINEYPFPPPFLPVTQPRSFFGTPPAGGLGWGLGAALGIKLAAPEKLVVAGLGDGSYFFNNPAVGHYIGAAHDLPVLVLVFNNERWNAVSGSTMLVYPDGYAAKLNEGAPLSQLKPSPAFEKYVEASGGLGIRVEDPDELQGALERGIYAVQQEKRQAVLNILIA
jgi:acetolactate synthase-1/2/3 large subunit